MTLSAQDRVENYFSRAGQLLLVRMPRSDDPLRDLRRFLMYVEVIMQISVRDSSADAAFNSAMQTCRHYAELLSSVRPIGGGPSRAEVETAHREAGDALLRLHDHLKRIGGSALIDGASERTANGASA